MGMFKANGAKFIIAIVAIVIFGCIVALIINATADDIDQAGAKKIALKDAAVSESELSEMHITDTLLNGKKVYNIVFKTNGRIFTYDIAKDDGDIINASFKTAGNNDPDLSDPKKEADNTTPTTEPTGEITESEARKIALDDAMVLENDAVFIKIASDFDDGISVYEIEFYSGSTEYDYKIAKSDGRIIAKDLDIENYTIPNSSETIISLEEARDLALSRVAGATASDIHIEFDYDDGRKLYEGEIYYGGMEYEFEIDATTSNFIEWSAESWH